MNRHGRGKTPPALLQELLHVFPGNEQELKEHSHTLRQLSHQLICTECRLTMLHIVNRSSIKHEETALNRVAVSSRCTRGNLMHHYHSQYEESRPPLHLLGTGCCGCSRKQKLWISKRLIEASILEMLYQSILDQHTSNAADSIYANAIDLALTYAINAHIHGKSTPINTGNANFMERLGSVELLQSLGFYCEQDATLLVPSLTTNDVAHSPYRHAIFELQYELFRVDQENQHENVLKNLVGPFTDGIEYFREVFGLTNSADFLKNEGAHLSEPFATLGCMELVTGVCHKPSSLLTFDDSFMTDEQVEWAFRKAISEQTSAAARSHLSEALLTIATMRNSVELTQAATTVDPIELDASSHLVPLIEDPGVLSLQAAFDLLGTSANADDETVQLAFELALQDRQQEKERIESAMEMIATNRKSDWLIAFCIDRGIIKSRKGSNVYDAAVQAASQEEDKLAYDPIMPVGIVNVGNTCYLNSLLQFYFTVKPLRDAILFHEHETMVFQSPMLENASRFAQLFRHLFCQMIWTRKRSVIPEERLVQMALKADVDAGVQQDISECMENISDLLSKVFGDGDPKNTLMDRLFHGTFTQQLSYKKNGTAVKDCKEERFHQFIINVASSLDTLQSSHVTLQDCLDHFFRLTTVDYNDSQAELELKVKDLPPVLVIQFQRAHYDVKRKELFKRNEFIQFGPTVNLGAYMAQPGNSNDYVLHGVFIHEGMEATFGHYYAFLCDHRQQRWIQYNDARVQEVVDAETEVFSDLSEKGANAYCLIYVNTSERSQLVETLGRTDAVKQWYLNQSAALRPLALDILEKET